MAGFEFLEVHKTAEIGLQPLGRQYTGRIRGAPARIETRWQPMRTWTCSGCIWARAPVRLETRRRFAAAPGNTSCIGVRAPVRIETPSATRCLPRSPRYSGTRAPERIGTARVRRCDQHLVRDSVSAASRTKCLVLANAFEDTAETRSRALQAVVATRPNVQSLPDLLPGPSGPSLDGATAHPERPLRLAWRHPADSHHFEDLGPSCS